MFSNFKHQGENRVEFKISQLDLSVVNSLRRVILSEIPCAAFYFDAYDQENKHINVIKNTGVLHNEFLSHRISLIPLYFTQEELDSFDENKYKFVLKKKNTSSEVMLVTTKDFVIYEGDKQLPETFREHIFPKCPITNDYILITKLHPNLYNSDLGEEIEIECKASIGTAQKHSRWCVVSQCCYYNTIDQSESQNAFKKIMEDTPQEEKKKVEQKFNVIDKYRHFKKDKYDEPNEFEFTIESECRLTPKQIFVKAISILEDKFTQFTKMIPDIKAQQIGSDDFYLLEIKNENHTLLNVLQALTYNKYCRAPEPIISFIGYYQSHPLDNTMFLKIKFSKEGTSWQDFIKLSCKDIMEYLHNVKENISKEWN